MAGIFQSGVWSCGFDFFTTVLDVFSGTSFITTTTTISSASARFAAGTGETSQGILFNGSGNKIYAQVAYGTNLQTAITGFAYRGTRPGSGYQAVVSLVDGSTCQTGLVIDSAGRFSFMKQTGLGNTLNGSVIAGPSTLAISTNVWNYIEFKLTVSSTVGYCEVRLNGVTALTFTGNTQQTANAYTTNIYLGDNGIGNSLYDDWYVLDTTGVSPLNTFLGDIRIRTYMPSADSATAGLNQFATSPSQSSGSHYLNVNEVPADGNTSYNSDATATERESYRTHGFNGATINFVNNWAKFEKDDATSRSAAITARNGTTNVVGTTISSPSSYAYFNQVVTTDPNTSAAWTPSGYGTSTLSNYEAGLEIIS
jgi:hypothetical protein